MPQLAPEVWRRPIIRPFVLSDNFLARLRGGCVSIFQDFDRGFFEWLNITRMATSHFKGSPELNWTKQYIKVCSVDQANLEDWAEEFVGGELTLCRTCFG